MPPSSEASTFTIFEDSEVALPEKVMFVLAVGFSPKLLQIMSGFFAGAVVVLVSVVTEVVEEVEPGQLPQSAEHEEQVSLSDASQTPFPQLGAFVGLGVGPTVGVGVGAEVDPGSVGVGVGVGPGVGVGVAADVGVADETIMPPVSVYASPPVPHELVTYTLNRTL